MPVNHRSAAPVLHRCALFLMGLAICVYTPSAPASDTVTDTDTDTLTDTQLQTPWGAPDLQGFWSISTQTTLKRPARYDGNYAMPGILAGARRAEADGVPYAPTYGPVP